MDITLAGAVVQHERGRGPLLFVAGLLRHDRDRDSECDRRDTAAEHVGLRHERFLAHALTEASEKAEPRSCGAVGQLKTGDAVSARSKISGCGFLSLPPCSR